MYYSTRLKVLHAGVPQSLASTRTMVNWVELVADKDNTGLVYIGGSNTTHGTGNGLNKDYMGIPLYKGIWLLFREMGGPPCYDLSAIYVDADNDNDAVDFVYGRA